MESFALLPPLTLWQVDVFSSRPLGGNPAAVIFRGEACDTATMQAIARETNLSETVFVLPPLIGGDARLRIFTTRREIPFAVHPAIAAAHAVAEATSYTGQALTLECQLGRVGLRRRGAEGEWHCLVPRARFQPTDIGRTDVAAMLGLAGEMLPEQRFEVAGTGVAWLMVEVASRTCLDGLDRDDRRIAETTRRIKAVGTTVYTRDGAAGTTCASMRSFAPAEGIYEDPVCGSCAGSLGALLIRDDPSIAALPRFFIEQGHQIGRAGRISVEPDAGRLWVGGGAATVLRGQLDLGGTTCRD